VSAKTDALNADHTADIDVTVNELEQNTVRIGVGASTNTGARIVFNYTDRNLFERGLLWDSSLRLEQRLQAATSNITFLTDDKGYRDSIQNSVTRTDLEGQVTTALQNGVRRYWGQPNIFEQYVGANLLYEFLTVDGESSQFNKAATLAYGLNIRRLDHVLAPTKGWILNTQFQLAPLDKLSDGRFLQSQARLQAFYPLTQSTQWLGRIEVGTVTGARSVPATYLFRAGGDQSVRGYAFQSLGVKEADAIVGGRVLLTGSTEVVQWLTSSWGAALFVDFGNAANSWKDYEPVLGYGLGARWRSPIGPVGVDIAHGQETGEYRLHFNLGVNF
jgi:translocation and assembly module TamA